MGIKYYTTTEELTSVAHAIRTRGQTNELLTYPDEWVQAIGAIPAPPPPAKDVNFCDYDGTIVDVYTAEEFLALDSMPACPAHQGLTSQGWNWSLAAAKAYVTANGSLEIGATYITEDGKTRFYVDMTETKRLKVQLFFSQTVAHGVSVDWGDQSAAETFAGTGSTTAEHTYEAAGLYVIAMTAATGCTVVLGPGDYDNGAVISTGNYSGRDSLLAAQIGSGISKIGNGAFYHAVNLKKCSIPTGVLIGDHAFEACINMTGIVIPDGTASLGMCTFRGCYSMQAAPMPHSLTGMGNALFSGCISLQRVSVPDQVTAITRGTFQRCFVAQRITVPDSVQEFGNNAFASCYLLQGIHIPEGITAIPEYCFHYCYAMTGITLPDTVTSIGKYAFSCCLNVNTLTVPAAVTAIAVNALSFMDGLDELHLLPETPPVLDWINEIDSLGTDDTEIYVPYSADHAVLAAYQAATNWCALPLTEEVET